MNLRDSARTIFRAALDAGNPRGAILRALQREGDRLRVQDRTYALHRVFVIGFGKASAAMAHAVEEILGDKIFGGAVSVKYGHLAPLQKISLTEAGHPLPDENSLRGAQKILDLLSATREDDLVICVISGGGSALLELPVAGVSLADLRAMTDALLRAGATINELNTLRKHLSQVKGGQLARASHAPIVSLILSDVLGSPLDVIASGPTTPDSTTFADARAIIARYNLRDQLPANVIAHLEQPALADTPKSDDPVFARVQNVIIADNAIACDAAMRAARDLGFNALLLTTFLQGEAREVAKMFAAIAREIATRDLPVAKPACLIAGGETTVTLRGDGTGGRNQEFALAGAIEIAEITLRNVVLLSGGTDGTDGPTDATGAIADGATVTRARERGMDARAFLARNDAHHFFKPLDDLIITGPTNTNLNDVIVMLVE